MIGKKTILPLKRTPRVIFFLTSHHPHSSLCCRLFHHQPHVLRLLYSRWSSFTRPAHAPRHCQSHHWTSLSSSPSQLPWTALPKLPVDDCRELHKLSPHRGCMHMPRRKSCLHQPREPCHCRQSWARSEHQSWASSPLPFCHPYTMPFTRVACCYVLGSWSTSSCKRNPLQIGWEQEGRRNAVQTMRGCQNGYEKEDDRWAPAKGKMVFLHVLSAKTN